MKTKIFSLILAVAMILGTMTVGVSATNNKVDTWDGTIDTGWYNTTDTEFTINSAAALAGFAAIANGTAEGIAADTFAGKTIKLGVDIDLDNNLWAPIGGRTSKDLSGQIECTFDGQNHKIYNLKVQKGSEYEAINMNIGLFGITRTGKFVAKDFTIENVDIYGSASVAAVLGRTVDCKAVIDNVDVIGNIKIEASTQNVGAICAQGYIPVITNCNVIGNNGSYIKAGTGQVGGILGWSGESSNATTVSGCSVENVTISAPIYVSAVVAIAQYGASVKNNTAKNVTLNILEGADSNEYFYGTIIGSTGAGYVDDKGNNTLPVYISGNTAENVVVTLNGESVASPVEFGAHYVQFSKPWDGTVSYVSAKIGDAYYEDIKVALDAADADDTVTLVNDITLNETVTIPAGKTATLDLNGKTITGTDSVASGNFRLIANQGTLTVDDNVGTGAITLAATNNRGYAALSAVISNEGGTLTVKNGKIEHLGGSDMAYGIDNNSTLGETKVVVKGGTIISPYRGIRAFQNSKTKMNSIVMEGGKIVARAGIWMHQSGADSLGEVTVTDGKIEAVANAIVTDIHSGAKTTITIKGGEFSNTSTTANLLLVWPFSDMSTVTEANKTILTIEGGSFDCAGEGNLIGALYGADANTEVAVSGGTFSEAIADEYIADGFKVAANADGTYGVKEDTPWTAATDAGYYDVDGVKSGLMRYLFHAETTEEILEAGIMYVSTSIFDEEAPYANQLGQISAGTPSADKAFYADIVNVPESASGSTYYAVAYARTESGTIWSPVVGCEPNFEKLFK